MKCNAYNEADYAMMRTGAIHGEPGEANWGELVNDVISLRSSDNNITAHRHSAPNRTNWIPFDKQTHIRRKGISFLSFRSLSLPFRISTTVKSTRLWILFYGATQYYFHLVTQYTYLGSEPYNNALMAKQCSGEKNRSNRNGIEIVVE